MGKTALWLALACAAALLFPIAPARAQWFSPWNVMQELDAPAIGMRQFREYARLLELSPDQKAAGEELLGVYEREYRAVSTRMKEISKSIQEEYDNDEEIDVWRDVWPKIIKNFLKKSEKLDKSLMDDLKSLLEPAQQSRWPQVERLHRRQSTLRYGNRAGEQIDLVELVDGLRLDEGARTSVGPVVEQYAGELDRELAARNKFMEGAMDRIFEVWSNWDEEKMKALYKEGNAFSQKVIDVNRAYARQIQGVLPADRQAEFDLKVKLATFPRVYKQTYALRVLDAAQKIPDLDPGQQEGLKGIREAFVRESAGINDRWSAALAEQEARQQENFTPWGWWGQEEDPKIAEARKQRKELEKKTVDSIKAILTEEQRKTLPDRKWKPEFDLDAPSPAKK